MRVVSEPAVVSRPDQPAVRRWAAPLRLRGDDRAAMLTREILLVLGLTLGYSAVRSVMSLIDTLTAVRALNEATTVMNQSPNPERPLFALFVELRTIFFGYLVPALFAVFLLNRDRDWSPSSPRAGVRLGLDTSRWRFDLLSGFGLALAIGVPGLGLYLAAREAGLNTTVSAANLTEWWAGPILVLLAAGNGIIEEVVVVGYLITRLRQTGWGVAAAIAFSAVLRGSYHLYQGFGAFVGNAAMGVVFALFFVRTRRLWPLILAHTMLDIVAFLGYTLLRDHLAWL
jgi:membrane protease YdiL (CAAX protease family)